MQQLQDATNGKTTPNACTRALLTTVPGVMCFIRHQMRRHRQAELTVPQFRVLIVLSRGNDVSLSTVAEHVGLSRSAASRMVDGLVQRGLVERQNGPNDRRRVALSLTRRGRATFRAAQAATQVAVTQCLRTLSARELEQVSAGLRVLNRVFAPESCSSGTARQ